MKKRTAILTLSIILVIALTFTAFAQEITISEKENSKISPYIFNELQRDSTVKVEVYLEEPYNKKFLNSRGFSSIKQKTSESFEEAFIAELSREEILKLASRKEVQSIAPNIELHLLMQDAAEIIDAEEAWDKQISGVNLTGTGGSVCVVDTGVEFSHPDLANKNIASGNFDCSAGSSCPLIGNDEDPHGHGTHVAGIAAASGSLNGVAKGSDIISARIYPPGNTNLNSLYIKRAIEFCTDNAQEYDIDVITISTGSYLTFENHCDGLNSAVTSAVNNAFAQGIPVVFGSGNSRNTTGISYPACIEKVIPVSGTDKDDSFASTYSNLNSLVKVLAPGTAINSTCLSPFNYCLRSGTSMSTPMVAGSIAIIKQALKQTNQDLTPHEIEQLLFDTGEQISDLPDTDWRRINVNSALLEIDPVGPEVELIAPKNNSLLPEKSGTSSADVDNNGVVDIFDLLELLNNWGATGKNIADINGDGVVDYFDLDLVLVFWDTSGEYADFTCNAQDWNAIDEVELNIWNENTQNIVYQKAKSFSSNNVEASFRVALDSLPKPNNSVDINGLSYGTQTYEWNCKATDSKENSDFATENNIVSIRH